ncbi:MAG TPA: flagellar motor protein [Stellaceae bacterium]|nr:flagellar motor protein [Stellaceae bacterium]
MDLFAIIALVSAVACICIAMLLDGGNLGSLLQLPAFIMVIGGTVSAVLLQTPFPIFMNGLKMLRWVFFPPKDNAEQVLTDIMEWVRISRRESILALDKVAETIDDPYTRQGLRLVVDGVEPSQIRAVLETMMHTREHHEHLSAEMYEAMGGYAPTVGILGAVLGLITVMANLGDPSKLGAGIATAFVATVYGVGAANLFFLPVANKLRVLVRWRIRTMDMILEGLVGIAVMEKPIQLEMRLRSFVHGEVKARGEERGDAAVAGEMAEQTR